MAFIPPLNLGQFQPSPATLSQWVYQIWQFLQENPIATEEEIRTFIQSELTESTTLSAAIEDYLTENPPDAPVQSVQGKTGAVTLAYNDIVTSSNTIPVYKDSSIPSTSTLVGQYNLGYRLFVNTATQEIFTISPAGALSLVGRGNFDGTTIDVNTSQGDTTIYEVVTELSTAMNSKIGDVNSVDITAQCSIPSGTIRSVRYLQIGSHLTAIWVSVDAITFAGSNIWLKLPDSFPGNATFFAPLSTGYDSMVCVFRTQSGVSGKFLLLQCTDTGSKNLNAAGVCLA